MNAGPVALRYATALFELAREAGELAAVEADVERLAADRAALLQEAGRESFGPVTLAREQQLLAPGQAAPADAAGFARAIRRPR